MLEHVSIAQEPNPPDGLVAFYYILKVRFRSGDDVVVVLKQAKEVYKDVSRVYVGAFMVRDTNLHDATEHIGEVLQRVKKKHLLRAYKIQEYGDTFFEVVFMQSKLSTDQEGLQPQISSKPATPSFRSSSYGKKQFRAPLSPANYASMHPRKENMLTPRTKNATAMDSIDKR
ncbi:hypothetical protein Tco_0557395 [Tanacetum coccineum]